ERPREQGATSVRRPRPRIRTGTEVVSAPAAARRQAGNGNARLSPRQSAFAFAAILGLLRPQHAGIVTFWSPHWSTQDRVSAGSHDRFAHIDPGHGLWAHHRSPL